MGQFVTGISLDEFSEGEVGDPDFSGVFAGEAEFNGGRHFWARSYCVSTVGLEEQVIREYIRNQEREEKRQEHMKLAGL